jgi:hypothetical protein
MKSIYLLKFYILVKIIETINNKKNLTKYFIILR